MHGETLKYVMVSKHFLLFQLLHTIIKSRKVKTT